MSIARNSGLFASELWTRALESYGRAVHMTIKLFDSGARMVLGPIHSTPLFQLFEETTGYEPGMFAECARRCLAEGKDPSAVMVSEFYGLSVIGTPLLLNGAPVGVAVAGYAFADFSQLSEVQRLARDSGIAFERLWEIARTQAPVSRHRLILNGELLHVLGEALLRENSRTRESQQTVQKLEETARTNVVELQRQKFESIGLLAAGVAHDFNNLLAAILLNASAVFEHVSGKNADRIKSVVENAEQAAVLVKQLLAYSGKERAGREEIDVSETLRKMDGLLHLSIPKSVKLAISVEARLPPLDIHPGQFQQIMMNLVSNAGEAIGDGNPGQITVTASMIKVEEPFHDSLGQEIAPGRHISIEVRDTGRGIHEENKTKIFDPFFSTKFTGRGLGLAALAGLLRVRKGAITFDSAPGAGSTFRVLLPVIGQREMVVEEFSLEPGRGTILIIDDDTDVRNAIACALSSKGYRILVAADGKEGLQIAERQTDLKLVVLDLIMPIMSAKDFLPAFRAEHRSVKVLLTSGCGEDEAMQLCAAFPGTRFIQKPYTTKKISGAVDDFLASESPEVQSTVDRKKKRGGKQSVSRTKRASLA